MSGHVTALYHNLYDAGRAIEDLVASGVSPGEISLITSEARAPIFEIEYDADARRSAAAFGAIGGALGAIGAKLTASPGSSAGILATGPLLTTLAGPDSRAHGLVGSLRTVGLSGSRARFYDHEIRRHDALMVGVQSKRHEPVVVRNILERHHATAVTEPV